ncbi:YtxH domain-containing protein [Streptomyces albidus (ex Kaewkla and Franco 2022)]|uniref:YtxH domain-containing protein n=1 Tax=Streptomyces albidus (ex Kaewkla and Franco 2022) TaxID=722709 RepID=UPI0015EF50EB|nr:YtxH domain-containing protein [Streptomyces albidus (ex Kaewkla and Franco 2022)]
MRYRLTFVAGLAVGYVFGTRAGRERYERLRQTAQRFAENPAVRNATETAAQTGREAASKAAGVVTEKVGHRLPDSVNERVRSLRDHRTPLDDDWGTNRK